MLLERHKQHLARFRIPIEMLRAAQVDSVSDTKARELMAIHGRETEHLAGIYFPYLSPLTGERRGARLKLDAKTSDDVKYLSEQGCRNLYYPPNVKELIEDRDAPIVIVEAEKSALALAAWAQRDNNRKLLPIAIGGCWGWKRNDGKVLKPSGGMKATTGPSPDFDFIKWENRTVVLAFDSNASTHKGVKAARDQLARELIGRGAGVMVADVTDENGVNGPDDLVALGDLEIMKMLTVAKQYKATVAQLADMPESVLDGKLGEICSTLMLGRFPVAYAWPSLVTVASSLVPRHNAKQRLNLYTALSGPVGTGKTQAINAAQQLLGIEEPVLMDVFAGSAESLMHHMGDVGGAPRLFSPDELSHLLEKASIQNATFASVLSRAYYYQKFTVITQGGKKADFNASLSILGGIVDNRFEELFSRATTAGLYDRFLFGACPGGFEFNYSPFTEAQQSFSPNTVFVAPEVWAEKATWKIESRVIEIALRVAIVCAAFDGRTLLRVEDLKPARALAEYEQRMRKMLKPNEGENLEAKIALKMLAYLERIEGDYVSRRKLLHDTGAYRFSPSVAMRALKVMDANGDIELTTKRPFMVRRLNMNGDGE